MVVCLGCLGLYWAPLLLINNMEVERSKEFQVIMGVLESQYGISRAEIQTSKRDREKVEARRMCMYFLHKLTDFSLAQIGLSLGVTNHATVLHHITKLKDSYNRGEAYRVVVRHIEYKISERIHKDLTLYQFEKNGIYIFIKAFTKKEAIDMANQKLEEEGRGYLSIDFPIASVPLGKTATPGVFEYIEL